MRWTVWSYSYLKNRYNSPCARERHPLGGGVLTDNTRRWTRRVLFKPAVRLDYFSTSPVMI
ncbi:hypothetical protein EV663_101165 [Rhodovulum bhavnagarense]|uniref:Uncharacterized protein n=1 Tax=Rhodovulum bhavnagarense TaxID=992286 RepID=A0A4R2RUU0_9RHOB|nr:hypothetical protein EV663_101165 [Rhodovulum bhavnagarense]